MPENPYQSPQSPPAAAAPESAQRTQARRWLRVSASALFVAALCNYFAYDSRSVARLPDDLAALFRTLNLLGFVVVGGLVWFLGLPLLEAIARLLRAGLASGCDPAAWDDVLYRSLSRVVYLAAAGAALWIVWVFGYYQLGIHF